MKRAESIADPDKRAVVGHYETLLKRFGPCAKGMDWKDEDSQRLRFAILSGICNLAGRSVHEVGCGVGHLSDHLRTRGIRADYSGSDLSPEMVAAAGARDPSLAIACNDILEQPLGAHYDVVVASGVFHVKLASSPDSWRGFVEAMLRRMYAMCQVGIAFNLMTDQVDFRNADLYYANPAEMLDFCRRELSRHVVVRHDYPLYEFTCYVYRNAQVA